MTGFREIAADLLDRLGAAVEPIEPEGLEVLAPAAVQQALDCPEQVRLGFGAELPAGARRVAIEGDWLARLETLIGERGRRAERQTPPAEGLAPADPERLLEHALELPNAVWRLRGMTAGWTRCLLLAFRYSALADEKRAGHLWLGFNLGTGAAMGGLLPRIRRLLADTPWQSVDPAVRVAAGQGWTAEAVAARVRPLLSHQLSLDLAPFLSAVRRRLERDSARIHGYHDELRAVALKRLAASGRSDGERAEADRRRERSRVEAIEREYRAKLDDLRHNYAVNVTVEWVQALDLYLPVQRFDVIVRRRKGERPIRVDWHPTVRTVEPLMTDWGSGLGRIRLVCDERLHLTGEDGQAPCNSCGRPWCRACDDACPRCRGAARPPRRRPE